MKKVIIIGSTSGIGKGLAELFAANNCKVGITGRRKDLLLELKDENPDAYLTKVLDVTDTASSIQQLEELTNELGGLDLLIIRKKKVVYVTKRWRLIAMLLKLIPRGVYKRM